MIKTTSHEQVAVGTYFTANCIVKFGSKPFYFYWLKNGDSIPNQIGDLQIDSFKDRQSILSIDKVKPNDAGNYTCVVRNEFGQDSHTVLLIVKGT